MTKLKIKFLKFLRDPSPETVSFGISPSNFEALALAFPNVGVQEAGLMP